MEPYENESKDPQRDQGNILKGVLPTHLPETYKFFKNALENGNTGAAKSLLREEGDLLLTYAAVYKTPQETKEILALAEKVPGHRFTIPYNTLACEQTNIDTVLLLLCQLEKQQDDINPCSDEGHYVIHYAAENGYLLVVQKIVEVLLARGKRDFESLQFKGRNALFLAIEAGQADVAEFLMSHTENINPVLDTYSCPLAMDIGTTAMHVAASWGKLKTLELLIKKIRAKNEKIDVRTCHGISLLHSAASNDQIETYEFIEQALLKIGEEIYPVDRLKNTPLHVAITTNKFNMIKHLLKKYIARKISINIEGHHGETPLHLAVKRGHVKVIAQLINSLLSVGETISPMACGSITPCQLAISDILVTRENTQISSAAKEKRIVNGLDIIELFLQPPSFNEPFLCEFSKNSIFSLCILYKKKNAVKFLLNKLIEIWHQDRAALRDIDVWLWSDISLGAIFLNNPEILDSLLQHLSFCDVAQFDFFKIENIQQTLKQAADANNVNIIKPIIDFLRKHDAPVNIAKFFEDLKKDATRSKNETFKKFLSRSYEFFLNGQKKIDTLLDKKLNILKTVLAPPFKGECTVGNEDSFAKMQNAYEALYSFKQELANLSQNKMKVKDIETQIDSLEKDLPVLIESYQAAKQHFFSEESRLESDRKKQLKGVVKDWENQLRLCLQQSSVQKTKEGLDLLYVPRSLKKDLQAKNQAFEQAVELLKLEITKSDKTLILSDLIPDLFGALTAQIDELKNELDNFHENLAQYAQKKQAQAVEKNLAQTRKQMEEILSKLNVQIEKIESFLKIAKQHTSLTVIYGLSIRVEKKDLVNIELALSEEKTKKEATLLDGQEPMRVHLQLCEANDRLRKTLTEISSLEGKIQQEKEAMQAIHSGENQVKHLKEMILLKMNQVSEIIDPILNKVVSYEKMIEDKQGVSEEVIKAWSSYKNAPEKLNKLKVILEGDYKIPFLERRLGDLINWLPILAEKREVLEAAFGQYHLQAANDPSLTPLPGRCSEAEASSRLPLLFTSRASQQAPAVLYGLSLSCVEERAHLNMMLDFIVNPANQGIPLDIKMNGLLWSLATFFEKMKQIAEGSAQAQNEYEVMLLKKSTNIRNFIFHHVPQIGEENYLLLCNHARILVSEKLDQRTCNETLNLLSSMLSSEVPDPDGIDAQIVHDRAYLRQYIHDVQNEEGSVNEWFFRIDFAHRLGRSYALLSDLKRSHDAIVRSKAQKIAEELYFEMEAFNSLGSSIPQNGQLSVSNAIDGLVQDLSKLSLEQISEHARPPKSQRRCRRR